MTRQGWEAYGRCESWWFQPSVVIYNTSYLQFHQVKTVVLIKEAIQLAFFRLVEYLEHQHLCIWSISTCGFDYSLTSTQLAASLNSTSVSTLAVKRRLRDAGLHHQTWLNDVVLVIWHQRLQEVITWKPQGDMFASRYNTYSCRKSDVLLSVKWN
jgi:hypothetical protein